MSQPLKIHSDEVLKGERFEFGKNWAKFLKYLDSNRIHNAENSLKEMLEIEDLQGKTFLDIGSGSGLFSLAARRLGAKVVSFDYDPYSVNCTKELKRRFFKDDTQWEIKEGSALNNDFLQSLGKFDIVYSWGVLHHTGSMWKALENAEKQVSDNGLLFIALYNHQQFATSYWTIVKKLYVKFKILRPILILVHLIYPTIPMILYKKVTNRKNTRGMTYYYDLLDWLGGYPFETSTPEQIFEFYKKRNFILKKLKTVGGKLGCNEFVFKRN